MDNRSVSSQVSAAVPKKALRMDTLPHKPFRLEAARLIPVIMVSVLRSKYNAQITHAITYVNLVNQQIARNGECACAEWPGVVASSTTIQTQFGSIGKYFLVLEYNIPAL